jgi:hypothetical protein
MDSRTTVDVIWTLSSPSLPTLWRYVCVEACAQAHLDIVCAEPQLCFVPVVGKLACSMYRVMMI